MSISSIFQTIFFEPLAQTLIFFYKHIPGGLGAAVILLTILIKIVLYPVNKKALDSQNKMTELQPRLKELQKKYKGDKEELGRRTMELYKEANLNPFSSIVLFLIQTPVLFAIYQVFKEVPKMTEIDSFFLGIDLAYSSIVLSLAASVLMLVQMKVSLPKTSSNKKKPDLSTLVQKQMQYVFPVFMFFILKNIPAAISLYLTVNAILTIIQTVITNKSSRSKI